MATQTSTFQGSTDLLNKLNTFMVANSWTKLKGETDLATASPKSARYWRILVLESEQTNGDFREIELMEWRTTSGGANVATTGANYTISNVASGSGSDLVSGSTPVLSGDIDDNWWTVMYDFGSGTIIREITIMCNTDNYAPSTFIVQWSNDTFTWTDMYEQSGLAWVDNETKTFTWDTGSGYTLPYHVSGTIARRSGIDDAAYHSNAIGRESRMASNWWSWQGPGYDADRRVYLHAATYVDTVAGEDHILLDASIASDVTGTSSSYQSDQEGSRKSASAGDAFHIVDATTGTYWFYLNSTRLIIVTRSGVSDYTCSYIGFLATFAEPDDWPFPLYVGGTSNSIDQYLSDATADVRDAADPGDGGAASLRLFDNSWIAVENHNNSTTINDPVDIPTTWNWPYHVGASSRLDWPNNVVGDYTGWDAHFLDRCDATDQGDLPLFPVITCHSTYGMLGALDGVFAIPSGGVVTAEQVLTISGDNYRVFTTRAKTNGMNFYAIKEV